MREREKERKRQRKERESERGKEREREGKRERKRDRDREIETSDPPLVLLLYSYFSHHISSYKTTGNKGRCISLQKMGYCHGNFMLFLCCCERGNVLSPITQHSVVPV